MLKGIAVLVFLSGCADVGGTVEWGPDASSDAGSDVAVVVDASSEASPEAAEAAPSAGCVVLTEYRCIGGLQPLACFAQPNCGGPLGSTGYVGDAGAQGYCCPVSDAGVDAAAYTAVLAMAADAS